MRARDLALIVAVAIGVAASVTADSQQPTPAEEARLGLIAARQEVMRLQGELAVAEQKLGECAAKRGQLELLINKAVIDGQMASFVKDYEAAHPGYTWSFDTRGPVKKPE